MKGKAGPLDLVNYIDDDGNPSGGHARGVGISIQWQNGPLGRGEDRKEPNGAFVEDVISVAHDRLKFYQESKFECIHNELALKHLELALRILELRTKERELRQVEGTHEL